MGADEKNPVLNRENLMVPIQKQLSQKEKTFSEFFARFLKSTITFKDLKKNMTLIDFVYPKLPTTKTRSDKCLKSLNVFREPFYKQNGKRASTLLKSASQHLYHIK